MEPVVVLTVVGIAMVQPVVGIAMIQPVVDTAKIPTVVDLPAVGIVLVQPVVDTARSQPVDHLQLCRNPKCQAAPERCQQGRQKLQEFRWNHRACHVWFRSRHYVFLSSGPLLP